MRARGVAKEFPARAGDTEGYVAVRDFDLDVRDGEFLVVVGPSGCGKSTVLNLLGGLDRPTGGELLLDGRPIDGPGLDRGIVFQQYALFPWRTALENVEFGLQSKGVARKDRRRIARDYLGLVGLTRFAGNYPHTLSGGMKQRVAIARALAYDPDVLLMDEPFAALDAQTRESLQAQLVRIWQETRKTVIFITHSIEEAVYLGERVAVMTAGPGRIKQIVDIDLGGAERVNEGDIRSSYEFTRLRHELWTLLKAEVDKTAVEPEPVGVGR
ncbi:ABC transporter ATP-binding protein [Actinoplanes ianthinogenes]|uniref:ABC transporter ATP-binding protein n=1 Tax=Actinoplanes ianthinogenes TaxID=122358 RepID=A0ABM7M6G4_9ACTN|nr:ABC transporter ATP-binding protein [Actinoplanes ianthinogenes]GGR42479.1 ABC transporter ATP-binding protein [Actinoplanes ianthinogenes]